MTRVNKTNKHKTHKNFLTAFKQARKYPLAFERRKQELCVAVIITEQCEGMPLVSYRVRHSDDPQWVKLYCLSCSHSEIINKLLDLALKTCINFFTTYLYEFNSQKINAENIVLS